MPPTPHAFCVIHVHVNTTDYQLGQMADDKNGRENITLHKMRGRTKLNSLYQDHEPW